MKKDTFGSKYTYPLSALWPGVKRLIEQGISDKNIFEKLRSINAPDKTKLCSNITDKDLEDFIKDCHNA